MRMAPDEAALAISALHVLSSVLRLIESGEVRIGMVLVGG